MPRDRGCGRSVVESTWPPVQGSDAGRCCDCDERHQQAVHAFMALLACVGIALGMTASVNADPNPFGDLKCSCDQPVPGQHRHAVQQIMQGIEQGLSDPSQRSTKRSE